MSEPVNGSGEHAIGYCLFDTAVGRCGLAWSARGLRVLQLPEADDHATRARVLEQCPQAVEQAPSPLALAAIDGVVALLAGARVDLLDVPLDLDGIAPFEQRVYEVSRHILPGATLTYGEVAERIGAPGAARAVGRALGRNPFAIVVPCHRVLAAGGRSGGFSAHGGARTKLRLLTIEGAFDEQQPGLFGAGAA